MRCVKRYDYYAIVKLDPYDKQMLGVGGDYAIIDTFCDEDIKLSNLVETCNTLAEAKCTVEAKYL